MSEQKILTPVAPLVLAGEQYLLAKNGGYSLHRPKAPDAFRIVAHDPVSISDPAAGLDLTAQEIEALLQHLGALIEENERLKKAVGKGGGMKLPSDDLPRVDGERPQEIGRIHLRGGEEEPTPFDRDLSKPRSSKGRRMRPKPQCP